MTMTTLNIFFIDDDLDYLQLVTFRLLKMLERLGIKANVYTFNSHEKLLKFISENKGVSCDVCVTDYDLGEGVNGIIVISQLKKHFPEAIYILISSKGNRELVDEIEKAGIYFYFHKSVPIKFIAYELACITKLVSKIKRFELKEKDFEFNCDE